MRKFNVEIKTGAGLELLDEKAIKRILNEIIYREYQHSEIVPIDVISVEEIRPIKY
jgi:hypothetical protein